MSKFRIHYKASGFSGSRTIEASDLELAIAAASETIPSDSVVTEVWQLVATSKSERTELRRVP